MAVPVHLVDPVDRTGVLAWAAALAAGTWSSMRGGRAVRGALRAGAGGEFKLRPPRGQRIARIQSGNEIVKVTKSGGVWLVRLKPRQEYTAIFE